MLFAVDYNDNRVHIDETHSNQEYYCPYCGAPLTTKKGEIRQHHFAHKQNHLCSDTWECSHSYDISPWHNDWQSLFPKENQEVKLSLGDTKHRADVMIDRTVIEFQHSIMPVKAFDDRNNFYFNLGNKVIWLFDLSDLLEDQLFYKETDEGLEFHWRNPKKAFNNYDIQSGCIDLFFQLKSDPEACIVRVKDVSANGFEYFCTSGFMSKNDFLAYVGLKNGQCLPPCREDLENDEPYWPQVSNATYKEVWVASITKWVWDMADNLTPGSVSGYLTAIGGAPVTFTSKATGRVFETYTHPRTGYFAITLPSGEYTVAYNGRERSLTVLSGKRYALDGALSELIVCTERNGDTVTVTVTANSEQDICAEVRAKNLSGIGGNITIPAGETITLTGSVIDPAVPYVGVVIPNGNFAEAKEIL